MEESSSIDDWPVVGLYCPCDNRHNDRIPDQTASCSCIRSTTKFAVPALCHITFPLPTYLQCTHRRCHSVFDGRCCLEVGEFSTGPCWDESLWVNPIFHYLQDLSLGFVLQF
jgi:hypothetical protein